MFLLPRSANRLAFPPGYDDEDIGFRCARDAAPPTEAASPRLP
jgi:hypothetical protein